MDIGQLRNNTAYYDGYEGEDEVIFVLEKDHAFNLHIWAGYLDDILRQPELTGRGWIGLTRDYHQAEGAFSGTNAEYVASPDEYLADLRQYQTRLFDAPETRDVFKLLIAFMQHAADEDSNIIIKVA